MADFINRKLQVFVSSTYEDLKPERQAAVMAILTAGHIPAGMELFTAGDESQMDVIKQWIDESDVYLLILGGRYGSIEPTTGKSYTHLEYEYALSHNKPIFACVVSDSAQEQRIRDHGSPFTEKENPKELRDFRDLVLSKVSRKWEDEKDIKIAVSETLANFARRDDLRGWVRPSDQSNLPALSDELARLSRENSELRNRVGSTAQTFRGISFEEMSKLLGQIDGAIELLPTLSANSRGDSLSRIYIRNNTKLDPNVKILEELVFRGLATRQMQAVQTSYFFTEEGLNFLNKLEATKHD